MIFGRCNEPPNIAEDNYEFIRQCEEDAARSFGTIKVRIDAAGYQASIIKYLMETAASGLRFGRWTRQS